MSEIDRPIAVDVYCCEGAVSRGLEAAGFEVVGIDRFKVVDPRTGKRVGYARERYPFPSIKSDALLALRLLLEGEALIFQRWNGGGSGRDALGYASGARTIRASDVALWWGSPPCQHASAGTRALRAQGDDRHPALIEPTRALFEALVTTYGGEWVIENVSGAALREPTLLCGSMFDLRTPDVDGVMLRLERHRLFEATFEIAAPAECVHDEALGWAAGVYGGGRRAKLPKGTPLEVCAPADRHAARFERHGGYVPRSLDVQRRLLGIADDRMTGGGMRECVPPVYAQHVGEACIDAIEVGRIA